jgi:hypothetical protein
MAAGDVRVTLHKVLPSCLGLLVRRIAAAAAATTVNVHVREGTSIAMDIELTSRPVVTAVEAVLEDRAAIASSILDPIVE